MSSMRKSLSIGVALAALVLAGCAASPDSESTGGIDPEIKKESQAIVAEFSQTAESRSPEPLSKKPPEGKTAVMISCPLPLCTQVVGGFLDATAYLKWDTRTIIAEFTPEAYIAAFESAIQLGPDYLFYIATQPNDVITEQLAKAKAAGISVVVNGTTPDVKLGPDELNVAGVAIGNGARYGKLQADIVIADAETLEGVTFVYDPAAPSYVEAYDAFAARIEEAGGTAETLEVNQVDTGAVLTGQIVSYLQRNPDTDYLVSVDNLLVGLADALSSASLPLPKLIGANPSGPSWDYLKDGTQFATVAADTFGAYWDGADIFARISVGDEYDPSPQGSIMIGTQKNVDDLPRTTFPGIPDNYLKAWLID